MPYDKYITVHNTEQDALEAIITPAWNAAHQYSGIPLTEFAKELKITISNN